MATTLKISEDPLAEISLRERSRTDLKVTDGPRAVINVVESIGQYSPLNYGELDAMFGTYADMMVEFTTYAEMQSF